MDEHHTFSVKTDYLCYPFAAVPAFEDFSNLVYSISLGDVLT